MKYYFGSEIFSHELKNKQTEKLLQITKNQNSMKKFSIIIIALFVLCSAFSQTVTLTFIGRDANNNWVQLEQNTPNPFNGVTLCVAVVGMVTLLDVNGAF